MKEKHANSIYVVEREHVTVNLTELFPNLKIIPTTLAPGEFVT